MARLSGVAGMRPSRPMSALAVVVGIGMLLTFATFFYSPLAGGGAFVVLWVVTLLAIIGYHVWNAVHPRGVPHSQVDFDIRHSGASSRQSQFAEQLRELDQLRRDGLISEAEFTVKRSEIMQSKW